MLDRFVAYNARRAGKVPAFVSLSRELSYAQLEATTSRLARALEGLRDLELRRVAVQCPDTWRHWGLVLALGRLGLASASLSNGEMAAGELDTLNPDLIILHGPGGLDAGQGRLVLDSNWFEKVLVDVERDGPDSYYPPVPVDLSAPCRAAIASGTGQGNCLLELSFSEVEEQLYRLIYHDNMEFFFQSANHRRQAAVKPQFLCTVGPQSLSGFLMAAAALAGGTTLRSSDSQNIGVEVMQASALLIVMTPVHLEHLLKSLPPQMMPVSHIYLTVVGGTLARRVLERTWEHFTPNVQVAYGTDECGVVAAIAAGERQNDVDVGLPMPWVEVGVVDGNGNKLLFGETGEIRIRGGGVVRSYAEDSPAGVSRFRDGWFYPGDRGMVTSDGRLHLQGRVDELVNVGGAKVDLVAVEACLRTEGRIRDVGVFTMEDKRGTEKFYAALVAPESFDDKALSIRLRQRFPGLPPLTMIWVSEIPRTREGHVDRRRLQISLRDYIRREL